MKHTPHTTPVGLAGRLLRHALSVVIVLTGMSGTLRGQDFTSQGRGTQDRAAGGGQQRFRALYLPKDTVMYVEMDTYLNSKRSHVSDRFTARVIRPVKDELGNEIIPEDAEVQGVVRAVRRAKYRRVSGIIEVAFDRIRVPGLGEFPIKGTLNAADGDDRMRVDGEGNISRDPSHGKHVVFIGAGAGVGAAVGWITSSVLLGAGIGAAVGVAAVFLSKGSEAEVEEGTRIEIKLAEPLTMGVTPVNPNTGPGFNQGGGQQGGGQQGGGQTRPRPDNSGFNSGSQPGTTLPPRTDPDDWRPRPPVIGGATGNNARPPAGGGITQPATGTGNGMATGPSLGFNDGELLRVSNYQIVRGNNGTVNLVISAQTNSSGWRLRTSHSIRDDTVEVWVLGDKPRGMVAQVISYPDVIAVIPDPNRRLKRLVLHGSTGSFRDNIPQ
ncbi:MAG: hypothetical protein ACKV2V_20280 [Blastocatellia bacterium]